MSGFFENDSLEEMLEKITDDQGVTVKFSDSDRNTQVLSSAVYKALELYRSKKKNDRDKSADDNTDALNNNTKEMKNTSNSLNKSAEAAGKVAEAAQGVVDEIKKDKKTTDAQIQRLTKAAIQSVLNVGSAVWDATEARLGWLNQLEKSGIRLAGGFDNTFTSLANSAKMNQDEFAKMLTTNSQQVNRINSMGSDNMMKLMKASGDLVGKFGYDTESASAIMLHYADTVARNMTLEEMRNRNISKEIEILGKNMKALSLATGKSVETLIKEQEQREKNLIWQKISRDPNMRNWISLLEATGLDRDTILAGVTGIPNEKSSRMHMTAGGRAIMQMIASGSQGVKSGRLTDSAEMTALIRSYQQDARVISENKGIETMKYPMAMVLSGTAIGDQRYQVGEFAHNLLNNANVGDGSSEEKMMNAQANTATALNKVTNEHIDNLALSMDTAQKALNIFATTVNKVGDVMEKIPDGLYTFGYGIVQFAVATKISELTFNKVLDSFFKKTDSAGSIFQTTASWFGTKMKQIFYTEFGKVSNAMKVTKLAFTGLGAALWYFEDEITKNIAGSAQDNFWGVLGSKTVVNAIAGGVIGGSMMGPKGFLWGLAGGALFGIVETIWDWFKGDESSDTPNEATLSSNNTHPGIENHYNTSVNTTHSTVTERANSYDYERTQFLQSIAHNTHLTSQHTIALPKIYDDQKLKNKGDLNYQMA